jgi:hypothetical protein
MWSIDNWGSQFEAFDLMMNILEEKGVNLVLRLHPNLGSKSRRYFLRETQEVLALQAKHPGLTIHWHNQPANSYVSYWMAQEHPLHRDWQSWASWNPEHPPMRMKLAQLTIRNSLLHKFRLLRLEVAKWQNHRFVPPGR